MSPKVGRLHRRTPSYLSGPTICANIRSAGFSRLVGACLLGASAIAPVALDAQTRAPAPPPSATPTFVRDPKIPIDEEYTKKIKEYTTEPYFSSPLVDYLPASKTVPTPKAVLGDIAGAPGRLPYAEEVYEYMRMLEKAAPGRVKVYSIGKTEEGREMIAVAISSEANMAKLADTESRLAKLADPRIDRDERRRGRQARRRRDADLLHHRHDPLARDRRAHRADGARLPPHRRRPRLHQVDPEQRDHAHHAGHRGGRPRQDGGRLQVAPRAPEGELAAARLLGQVRRARQQPRRDGRDAEAHRERARTRT